MKTIGIIGGMSWESSLEYYRIINEITRERLGGLHSAPSVMVSVDFAAIEAMQSAGEWDKATDAMVTCARQLEAAHAACIVIATNTMHLMYSAVQESLDVPVLHIADAAARKITDFGIRKVGLLGTRFTMEMDFYAGRLKDMFGIETIVPDQQDRDLINSVIYDELVVGQIRESSKREFVRIIDDLAQAGASGIILGCTEIPLLVEQEDADIPLFDTTYLHAEYAVDFALA